MNDINKKQYQETIDKLELQNIFLSKLCSSVEHELIKEDMHVKIDNDSQYKYFDNKFIITCFYTLEAKNNDDETALKVDCTYKLHYVCSAEINDDFFEIYKKTSLPINIWPYFREQVNNITARMNIPPLTIPLLKSK